jgi:hypothetical protein
MTRGGFAPSATQGWRSHITRLMPPNPPLERERAADNFRARTRTDAATSPRAPRCRSAHLPRASDYRRPRPWAEKWLLVERLAKPRRPNFRWRVWAPLGSAGASGRESRRRGARRFCSLGQNHSIPKKPTFGVATCDLQGALESHLVKWRRTKILAIAGRTVIDRPRAAGACRTPHGASNTIVFVAFDRWTSFARHRAAEDQRRVRTVPAISH